MRRVLVVLIVGFLIFSCDNPKAGSIELFQPDWTGINTESLPVKIGQVLKFKNDSREINAVVLDFDQDEGGIWIGLCFINQGKIFGRQIPQGPISTTCIDLFDFTYLNLKGLKGFEVVDSIPVDKSKVGIGSMCPAISVDEMIKSFDRGLAARKKNQTPCEKGLTDIEAVRECYFTLDKINVPGDNR